MERYGKQELSTPPPQSRKTHPPLTPKRSLSDNTIFIPELVFTADRINKYDAWVFGNSDPDHPSNHDGPDIREFLDHLTNPFGGGGNSGNSDRTYDVVIEKEGRGVTSGQGTYDVGAVVHCNAAPLVIGDIATSEFINWSGHVNSDSPSVTFTIPVEYVSLNPIISLTAHFHNINPCADEENDRRDPLMKMKIQASGKYADNIEGGTFGWTRNGGTTEHKGMDFACPIGTPVFATHSGTVSNIRTGFSNDETWDQYQDRTGVGNSFRRIFNCGNIVDITCWTNGGTYIMKYWHLTSVEETLWIGKEVEAGDIIGYSGKSGNATSEDCGGPHLHYQVNYNGKPIDPRPFIYSVFNDEWVLTNPCNQ